MSVSAQRSHSLSRVEDESFPPPGRYPNRSFVVALSSAIWSVVFASVAAETLLDHGLSTFSLARLLAHFLGCALGIGMCLILGVLLRRVTLGGYGAAIVVVGACASAILWASATRLAINPLVIWLVSGLIAPLPDAGVAYRLPVFWVALIFAAWAGAWLAVAFADDLRDTQSELRRRAMRILELESLVGHTSPEGHVDGFWVPTRDGTSRVAAADIVSVHSERDYVKFVTSSGRSFLVRATLQKIISLLDPSVFVQVHRSTVVHSRHVQEIIRRAAGGSTLVLDTGSRIAMSRRFAAVATPLIQGSNRP